ncbi:hypothetical protein [Borrelia hispanica]|uniref:hypothetical protein n=1 Tax=Borrelia hispanica TaxID=40835 RepID=UPI000465D959|nr:hypothetical protein [Borrelia hispanica]
MQKLLQIFIILCLLTNCDLKTRQRVEVNIESEITFNQEAQKIIQKLNPEENEALMFVINALYNKKIAKDHKAYTIKQINDFIIHLDAKQIREMIANIIKILKETNTKVSKEKKETYHRFKKVRYFSHRQELNERLDEIINKYAEDIKKAANQDSFDIAKINIQNTLIDNDEIKKIYDEVNRALEVQRMYDRAKKDDKNAWASYHIVLIYVINHQKACTYDQFNKFILDRKADKIKAIFAKLAIDMKAEASAKKTILQITDESQQNKIYTQLCLHAIYSRQAIANAISSGNLDFDQIEANLMQLPSDLDKIKALQKQAEDILKEQNKETK